MRAPLANLSVTIFAPGPGGVPTTEQPRTLARLDSYEDSITAQGWYEAMTVGGRVASLIEALDLLNRLMGSVVVSGPRGQRVWEGFVSEVALDLGNGRQVSASLADMANAIRVGYDTPTGAQAATTVVTAPASIARYGRKERAINFGTTTAAAAANRAQVVLNGIAYPGCKQEARAGTGRRDGGIGVTIRCRGWVDALAWLPATNASTTVTTTSTQALALLAAYNATNAFFSVSAASVVATGIGDTETASATTTYLDKLSNLMAVGTAAQQRVAWGIGPDRALIVRPWAGASPATIAYRQSAATHQVVDGYGNTVDPWDVTPDAMVQIVDLAIPAPPSGAIDTATRMYASKVSRRLSRDSAEVTFASDDAATLEELLTRSSGSPNGTSARQAAIERQTVAAARPHFSGTNGTVDLGGTGSINTGGGSINTGGGSINTGGGSINTGGGDIANTGGGDVDLGTGAGIGGTGSSGVSTPTPGTPGRLTRWKSGGTSLEDANALITGVGVLTLAVAGAYTLTIPATGTAALGIGSAGALAKWTDGNTLASAVAGTDYVAPGTVAPIDARYLVATANGTLTNEVNLGALGSGLLKQAVSGGVATISIAVAGTDYLAPGDAGPVDARYVVTTANGTLTNEVNLGALGSGLLKQAVSGGVATISIAVAGTDYGTGTVGGTGTAGRLMQWATGGADAENSTLIKTGTGVLTLATGSNTMTLTLGASGGTINLAGNTLTLAGNLITSGGGNITLAAGGAYTLTIPKTGTVPVGTGSANRLAYWSGTNDLTYSADLRIDAANGRLGIGATPNRTLEVNGDCIVGGGLVSASLASGLTAASGQIRASDTIRADNGFQAGGNPVWVMGAYTATSDAPIVGYASVSIGGTVRKVAVIA